MVIFTLAGCGSGGPSGRTRKQPYGVRDVLEEGMAAEDNKKDSQDSPPSETVTDRNDERQNGVNEDAAACCSQGIEFVLTDEYSYPDDYPEEGREICVVGVFDTYQEGGYTYCTLRDAKMLQRKF